MLAREALAEARRSLFDVLIVDTAGRLHVDDEMMVEIRDISAAVDPTETLFVVDSMAGQDAVNAARAFGQALTLTGVVLTKTDGDARGGAALSVRQITGQPILFMGTGEKTEALEAFQAERVASRILGMGDVLALVENVTRNVDREQAEKLARKLKKGKDFDLEDLHDQLQQVEKMGGLSALMDKLPAQLAEQGRRGAAGQRQGDHAPDRCHPFDDTRRAPLPEDDRRLPQAADRRRLRRARLRGQPPAQELPANAEDDENDVQGRRPAAADGGDFGREAWPGLPAPTAARWMPVAATFEQMPSSVPLGLIFQ